MPKKSCFVVWALLLSACDNTLTSEGEKDLAVIGESCFLQKSEEKQKACIQAAVRLSGKQVPEAALPKRPPVPLDGQATEEIKFKNLAIGRPGEAEKLISMCPKPRYDWDVCPTKESLAGNCPKEKDYLRAAQCSSRDGIIYASMHNIDFGNFPVSPSFNMTADGTVHKVSFSGEASQMQAIILLLTTKYGPPKLEKSEVQNGFGNKFDTLAATWADTSGTTIEIRAGGENGKVSGGSFSIRSAARVRSEAENATKRLDAARAKL
jgi:hypothetical protein